MASSTVKGITIVLGADASELTSALNKSENAIKSTQKSLREVDKALKFNPNNIELLKQKEVLLNKQIDETKNKLKLMKDALSEMDAKGIDKTSSEYMQLQREIITTESKLENFNAELKKTQTASSSIGQLSTKFDELGNKMNSVGKKITSVGNSLKYVSAAAATALGASIKYASDLEESMNKVEVAFGKSSKSVEKFASTSLNAYGIAEGTALDMSATFGDMATSMGLSQKQAAEMATSLTGLAGDLASFKNIGIDQATTALNGVFTGETESLKSLGIVMTQTNLDAFALANGFGKTTKEMTEAEKVSLRYAYIMDKTKNAQGDFARTNQGTANQLRIVQEGLKQLASTIGSVILPVVAKILSVVNGFIAKISNMGDGAKKFTAILLTIVAAAAPVLLTFGKIVELVGSSITAFGMLATKLPSLIAMFNALKATLVANPVILIITALVALTVILDKNRDSLDKFGKKVDAFINNVLAKAGQMIETVVTAISNNLPQIITVAIQIITSLVVGLIKALPQLIKAAPQIIKAIVSGLNAALGSLASVGKNIIKGLWNGAKSMVSWVVDKFKGLGKSILKGIKSALGIHSPSRVFRDEVGKNIMLGLANGISGNMNLVSTAMNGVANRLTGTQLSVGAMTSTPTSPVDSISNAIGTGLALSSSGSMPSMIHIVCELGGNKVGETVVDLYDRTKFAIG